MKIKQKLVLLPLLSVLLVACNNNEPKEYKFEESSDYVFKPSVYENYFTKDIDYKSYSSFSKSNYYVDSSIEPTLIFDDSYTVDQCYPTDDYFQPEDKIFDSKDDYKFIYSVSNRVDPVIIPTLINDHYEFRFYATNTLAAPGGNPGYGPYMSEVNIVKSNNEFGYFINMVSVLVLPLINNTPSFPYDVYIKDIKEYAGEDVTKMILIPKKDNFSKQCYEVMNKYHAYHYFDFNSMNNYLENVKK